MRNKQDEERETHMEVWNNRVRGGPHWILFLVFRCAFSLRHFHRLSSLSHTLIAVFAFSSAALWTCHRVQIHQFPLKTHDIVLQICKSAQAQVRFDFSPDNDNNNSFTISIYLLPSEESDQKSYNKKNWWARTVIEVVAWHETSDDFESHTSWYVSLCKRRPPLNIL